MSKHLRLSLVVSLVAIALSLFNLYRGFQRFHPEEYRLHLSKAYEPFRSEELYEAWRLRKEMSSAKPWPKLEVVVKTDGFISRFKADAQVRNIERYFDGIGWEVGRIDERPIGFSSVDSYYPNRPPNLNRCQLVVESSRVSISCIRPHPADGTPTEEHVSQPTDDPIKGIDQLLVSFRVPRKGV